MKHLNGKYDLTIDDIHEIRKEISNKIANMSYEEIKSYYDEQEKIFNKSLDEVKNQNLQLV